MAEFWRTRQFKNLSITWNKKLERSGFEDAEVELKGDRALKQNATNSYRQADELERETRLSYYSLMGFLAHNTVFPTWVEQTVMIKHSDGATVKEISEVINSRGITRARTTIECIIKRWQNAWGVKSWTQKQMYPKRK